MPFSLIFTGEIKCKIDRATAAQKLPCDLALHCLPLLLFFFLFPLVHWLVCSIYMFVLLCVRSFMLLKIYRAHLPLFFS